MGTAKGHFTVTQSDVLDRLAKQYEKVREAALSDLVGINNLAKRLGKSPSHMFRYTKRLGLKTLMVRAPGGMKSYLTVEDAGKLVEYLATGQRP